MRSLAALLLGTVLLAGCSGSNTQNTANTAAGQAKEEKKEAEVELKSAREAIYMMYTASRGWAADARPYKLESEPTSKATGQDGKSSVWRAYFASPSKRQMRTYLWSGMGDERGVNANVADDFNPANPSTQPFAIENLKIDSDKALETANKQGGDKLLKENAEQQIKYMLEWVEREKTLYWHVIYGDNMNDAKLVVTLNATTGGYIRKTREGKLAR